MTQISWQYVAWLLVAVLFTGCNGNPQISGARVVGKVTYKSQVLTGGEIIFVDPNDPNKSTSGRIEGDGTFDVPNVPIGNLSVLIDTTMAKYDVNNFVPPKGEPREASENPYLKNAPAPSTPPMKYMPINKKYAKIDTSPLKITVQKGTTTQNFDLD